MRAANRHHQTLIPLMSGGNQGLVRNGLVAEYRFDESRNLLKYSQQFDNAAWTKTDCAIAANDTAAPDGTTTADKVTLTVGAAQSCVQSVTVAASTAYVFSIWVKLGTATALKYAIYNVSGSADIIAATSYGATTSWVRYAIPFTTPAGCTSVSIRPVKDSAQDNGTTAWIWGAQLEAGSVARTYYPTMDKQLLMDYSRPRKNLLLPNQANCCEDGTCPFTKLTAGDAVTASAGEVDEWQGMYCAKVDTANAAANEGIYTTDIIYDLKPSTAYTASGYIRGAAGGETVKLGLRETTDAGVTVDTTGSDTLTLTTGWQRVTVSRTFGTTGRGARLLVYTPTQQNIVFYVDGLQLEEGSVATAWEAPPNIGVLGSTTGSDTNDPTWTGDGASFTTDDYIIIPAVLAGKSAATILIVFKTTATVASCGLVSVPTSDSTNSNFAVSFRRGSGDYFNARASDGTNRVGVDSNGVSVFDGSYFLGILQYIGGSSLSTGRYPNLVGTTTTSVPASLNPDTTKTMYLGDYTSAYLTGGINYLVIYDRALTQAEITQNYNYLKGYLLRERGITI